MIEPGPARILVVDDEPSNRKLMGALLEQDGYDIRYASSGAAALEELAREPVELILLDVMMPGMSGIDVTAHIKTDHLLCDIPIIVVTSADDEHTRLAVLEAGAEEFLGRPIQRLELRQRVRNLVRLKRLADAMRRTNEQLQEIVDERTREVRQTAEQLQNVLDALPVILFTARLGESAMPEIDWVSENVETVTGLPSQTWQTGRWADYLGDEVALREAFAQLVSDEQIDTRFTLRDRSEQVRMFMLRARRLPDGRVFGVAFDVSEYDVLERALRETRRMEAMGQLAGGVAHDFNNLLMIITAYASFASDALGEDHPARSELQEVLQASEKAAALTRQLLLFSRQRPAELRPMNVVTGIETLTKLLHRSLGENIDLELFVAAPTATVRADPAQFDQLFMNLAVNARDAMPEGGKLAIAVESVELATHYSLPPGPYIRLKVSDTGIGMPAGVIERVFEPFFTTKGQAGTGLGLATVYGIVQTFDGAIDVESEVGIGTTFTVLLPSITDDPLADEVRSAVRVRGDECILVVEDRAPLRRIAYRTLQSYGYSVLLASDPIEARQRFDDEQARIDFVMTDIVLPNGDGEEFAHWVAERAPHVKVLLTSGYLGERTGRAEPEFPILWKPYTPIHLVTRIREILDA